MSTLRLAEWSISLEYSSLPQSVIKAAQRSLYNYIGCTLGGSDHPTTQIALRALRPLFGIPTSTIYGSNANEDGEPLQTDASHSALINGIASHVHDYDDTHLDTIIHPTGPVASALLAQVEAMSKSGRTINGEDVILALVVGMEAECK
jgi:aconitate decarboxylase